MIFNLRRNFFLKLGQRLGGAAILTAPFLLSFLAFAGDSASTSDSGTVSGFTSKSATSEAAEQTVLSINCGNSKSYKLSELKAKIKSKKIAVKNPFYENSKIKKYEAFDLVDVLELASCDLNQKFVTTALDGYRQTIKNPSLAIKNQGYLVYKEMGGWSPLGAKAADPGPLFLVWSTPNKSWGWPYQLQKIEYQKTEHLTELPASETASDSVVNGHKLFNQSCAVCHQVGSRGGELGPNLTEPFSVTEYIQKDFLIKLILDRTSVRTYKKSLMPIFKGQLSEAAVKDIVAYIDWYQKNRVPPKAN